MSSNITTLRVLGAVGQAVCPWGSSHTRHKGPASSENPRKVLDASQRAAGFSAPEAPLEGRGLAGGQRGRCPGLGAAKGPPPALLPHPSVSADRVFGDVCTLLSSLALDFQHSLIIHQTPHFPGGHPFPTENQRASKHATLAHRRDHVRPSTRECGVCLAWETSPRERHKVLFRAEPQARPGQGQHSRLSGPLQPRGQRARDPSRAQEQTRRAPGFRNHWLKHLLGSSEESEFKREVRFSRTQRTPLLVIT